MATRTSKPPRESLPVSDTSSVSNLSVKSEGGKSYIAVDEDVWTRTQKKLEVLRLVFTISAIAFSIYLTILLIRNTQSNVGGGAFTESANTQGTQPRIRMSGAQAEKHLEDSLSEIVGMDDLKSRIRNFVKAATTRKIVAERFGQKNPDEETIPNMTFEGPPGTGKSTIGKILAETLWNLGLTQSPKYKCVTAVDLIGRYVGETENNTKELMKAYKGGVVMIDEIGQTIDGFDSKNSFNKGLRNVLMQFSTPGEPGRPIIIIAGYKHQLDELRKSDDGLKSRFPPSGRFVFSNYTAADLILMTHKKIAARGYHLHPQARMIITRAVMRHIHEFESANGRLVADFVREIQSQAEIRLPDSGTLHLMDREKVFEIQPLDILEAEKLCFTDETVGTSGNDADELI